MRGMYIKLLLLLSVVALISGCAEEDTGFQSPFIGGVDGFELEFLSQSPPDEIFDNGQYPFSIQVQVTNVGEYSTDENDGYVFIEGISAEEYGLTSQEFRTTIPAIDGARKDSSGTIVDGRRDVVSIDNLNYQQDIAGSLSVTDLRVVACYNYKTKNTASICIKQQNFDIADNDEVCQIQGEKSVASSGGPIQITKVREVSQGSTRVQVELEISHVGDPQDKFFKVDSECTRDARDQNRYKVYVEVDSINNGRITPTCSGFQEGGSGNSGFVFLPDGKPRQIFCQFDISSVTSDFETQFNVDLEYRYMEYITKSITIKDLGLDE